MLWPMALAQLCSWGTLLYSFSLFAGPMSASLSWSTTALNGALTAGLLLTAFMAYPIGALLDRHGGRVLMTIGSVGAGVLLLLWSQISSLAAFYGLWLGLGACMSTVLIESAFAVINQNFGADTRRGITALTLVTGFSGTVFVPLVGHLIAALGWRETLLVLAALNLCFSAPVHWTFVPPRMSHARDLASADPDAGRAMMRQRLRNPVFWGLVLWFTSYSLTASGLIFQLVPLLKTEGAVDGNIFLCFALIGPIQVLARILAVTLGSRATTARLGAFTSSLVPMGVLVLMLAPHELFWLCVFSCCFGVGHGITTILRGVAPAEWLGRDHYGRTMGALALPMMVAMAVAPLLTALVWSAAGSTSAVWWTILAGSLAGSAGFWLAVLARARQG